MFSRDWKFRWLALPLAVFWVGALVDAAPAAAAKKRPSTKRSRKAGSAKRASSKARSKKQSARKNKGFPLGKKTGLVAGPTQVTLTGKGASQKLAVAVRFDSGAELDVTSRAKYALSKAAKKIIKVDKFGVITPLADGEATIKVSHSGKSAWVKVTVVEAALAREFSFAHDIVPILTKAGCDSLTCHGSPVGKNGFKLSLYGISGSEDYNAIVKQDRAKPNEGKRVNLEKPEESLILKKPTMAEPHGGGMRFEANSPEAAVILNWLKNGAPADDETAIRTVERLEVFPAEIVAYKPDTGSRRHLVVMAHFSDGSTEDVTKQTIYSTNDDAVAIVDEASRVVPTGMGETMILARYRGKAGTVKIHVPMQVRLQKDAYAHFQPANRVDELALAKWRKMRYVPAAAANDYEFLRRVSLDLIATLPTPDEIRAFVASDEPDKRAKKIDELMARPEFNDWWTVFWGDMLRINGGTMQAQGAKAYRDFVYNSISSNKRYDQFVKELVLAKGTTFAQGQTNFYRAATKAPEMAEQVAQLFMGVQLQCARCHNHPFEKWTQNQYHAFAAIFARTRSRNLGGKRKNEYEISVQPKGEYRNPVTRQNMKPELLSDKDSAVPVDGDRRVRLAEWLTSKDNRLFTKNISNRIWAMFFGRGLVNPVDDVRVTNPASNEALLDHLADELVAHDFDLQHVMKLIANSSIYQLSSQATDGNVMDQSNFSRSYLRRMGAEQLLDAICQVTNVPENYKGYPKGTRAIQLTDNRVSSYFLDVFGRPKRQMVCSCEREETANLTQTLHLINGNTLNSKLGNGAGRCAELAKSEKSPQEMVTELYLWTVSRPPTEEESSEALARLEKTEKRQQALEDELWMLLNSQEFVFNH